MADDPEQLDVTATRATYDAARSQLVDIAGGMFADGEQAAAHLLTIADEYGAREATMRLLEHAEGIGPLLARTIESQVADQSDYVEQALEAVLEAQDRLDLATARREDAKSAKLPGHQRVLNINGREFVIDVPRRELRSADNPAERYELGEDVVQAHLLGTPPPEIDRALPTLTEQLARDSGVAPAQPKIDRDKGRGR